MKAPVEIDLRRASFILCPPEGRGSISLSSFENGAHFPEEVGVDPDVGRPSGPTNPSQIMARASAARANRNWDKSAIFSRSCLLVTLPEPSLDSSFILLTSRETCSDSISGKLRGYNYHLRIARARKQLTRERNWKILRSRYRNTPGFRRCEPSPGL